MKTIDGVELPEPMANYEEAIVAKNNEMFQRIAEMKKAMAEHYGAEHAAVIMEWVYRCIEASQGLREIELDHWGGSFLEASGFAGAEESETLDFINILRRAKDYEA